GYKEDLDIDSIYKSLRPLDLETFLVGFDQVYAKERNIPGCAIFFVGNPQCVSPYIIHCMTYSRIIYERNIFLSVTREDTPFGIEIGMSNAGKGLDILEVGAGYKEDLDIESIIKSQEIVCDVIFYGVEDIRTENFVWKTFALIKKISPTFVQYYNLSETKIHGVVTRVVI
ncbi:MAG: KUP/HAK/KT family potassium transporter, partial [Spirochaetota bacterium]